MEKSFHRKHVLNQIGPGGLGCPCCAPAPGKRAHLFRVAKRRVHREVMKVEFAELNSMD